MMTELKKLDENNLPIYDIVVDENDETGISLISLVDEPAINIKGMAFSKSEMMTFKVIDKQIIVGPALIPDMKIYREDEKYGRYYVKFSPETIVKMVEKFNKYGSNRKINIDHSKEMVNAFIMEDWIIEDEIYDKSKKYGFNLPVGTYMVKVKIEDKDFWLREVKDNGKFGFSIEGLLGQQLVQLSSKMISKYGIDATIDDFDLEDLLDIFNINKFEKGVPHYTKDGELYTGPTHKDADGRLMTGATHTEDSEYLYHIEELATIGPKGGIKESKKAPKSSTPNPNPKGRGTAPGSASTTRGAEVSAEVEASLKTKVDEFNDKYKKKLGYGVNVGMLKSVYQRGIGAFATSHSPEVKSANQWAQARVNAFLYIVKNGRPENPKYTGDFDLLPKDHPKRDEEKKDDKKDKKEDKKEDKK